MTHALNMLKLAGIKSSGLFRSFQVAGTGKEYFELFFIQFEELIQWRKSYGCCETKQFKSTYSTMLNLLKWVNDRKDSSKVWVGCRTQKICLADGLFFSSILKHFSLLGCVDKVACPINLCKNLGFHIAERKPLKSKALCALIPVFGAKHITS